MKNGWTGGQLAILRAFYCFAVLAEIVYVLARSLSVHWSRGGIHPGPYLTSSQHLWWSIAAIAIVLAGLGIGVRWCAIAALFMARHFALTDGFLPDSSWSAFDAVMIVCVIWAALPNAPLGSWPLPWRKTPSKRAPFPRVLFTAVWCSLIAIVVIAQVHRSHEAASGDLIFDQFDGAYRQSSDRDHAVLICEALFVATAPFARLRLVGWLAMLAVQVVVGSQRVFHRSQFVELNFGVLALQLMAFDPGWIAPRKARSGERIFYDGACGLCHRFVTFVLAEDRAASFRFAPLGGAAFEREIEASARADLPDSIVVRTANGELLVRSRAALYVLERLGGLWRLIALVARLVPRPLADFVYDGIARLRSRVFAKPSSACPLMPPELALRFDS